MSHRTRAPRALQREKDRRIHVRIDRKAAFPLAKSFLADGWDKLGCPRVFQTGVPFLDVLLGGGHAPEDVIGVMGPDRSDNTALAVMLCCEAARQAAVKLQDGGTSEEYAVLVNYRPAPRCELEHRALSYAAAIHTQLLANAYDLGIAALSTGKTLRDYEKVLFQTDLVAGREVPGELDRLCDVFDFVQNHLIILNMNGDDPSLTGEGFLAEIADEVERRLKQRGPKARCRLIAINDARDMAERHTWAKEQYNRFWDLVRGAGLMAKPQLAYRLHCPVWLMYGLTGPSTHRYQRTASWESRHFEEYLDFALVMEPGYADGDYRIVSRRARRPGGPAQLVRVNDELNRLENIG